ncbi:molybdate ABC transporter permease subunit [Haliscomenobacter sp.]|uniref:molybdate ABC transporter permease subunit n=1 Tax=Haliscomenobacter sp. TaxID=2717303 RepID=UPI0033652995
MDFTNTLLLTLRLAAITTFILLLLGIPVAYGLARSRSAWKPVFEALVSMPLVLPPTVIGFYLLLALSPNGSFGHWLQDTFEVRLVFTFSGLVLGSLIYSFPFMVQPLQSGFENLPAHLAEASYTLGKSSWTTLWWVLLPNIRPALLSGIVLAFAHTVGEFGVVLMIGGNIPGVTRVASIAIYDEVEALNFAEANRYALNLVLLAFVFLVLFFRYNRRSQSWTL